MGHSAGEGVNQWNTKEGTHFSEKSEKLPGRVGEGLAGVGWSRGHSPGRGSHVPKHGGPEQLLHHQGTPRNWLEGRLQGAARPEKARGERVGAAVS